MILAAVLLPSTLLFFSPLSHSATCTKTNFSVGYEVTATGEPNANGQYTYTVSPLRCDASGQVVYDPGIGFGDGDYVGQQTPDAAYAAFKNSYLYNMRSFEGACKFSYIGIHSYYNGAIDGVVLTTSAYPVSQTQYRNLFYSPLHQNLSATAGGIKKDSASNPATGACSLTDQKKSEEQGGGNSNAPKQCVGNPLLPGRGCKVQTETDYL
ncbi:MAG: hypothetical protein LBJ76_02035, partial [Candidatus Accumulibacter sp.]|nr:hypothetical protein [Accumulibacter sp.]